MSSECVSVAHARNEVNVFCRVQDPDAYNTYVHVRLILHPHFFEKHISCTAHSFIAAISLNKSSYTFGAITLNMVGIFIVYSWTRIWNCVAANSKVCK